MLPAIYDTLVSWYPLLDPLEDHAEEVAQYASSLERAITGPARTLLELGAGAGNNGHYLARRFQCTLTDLSPGMLALSEAQNPGCTHHVGDMRSLRLGHTYDAVLVHDAIAHMTTRADARAVIETAYAHVRPGGAAIIAPDLVREAFQEMSDHFEHSDGARTLRCLEWCWDADPTDEVCQTDYAFLLRDGAQMTAVHDVHVEGLFPEAFWLEAIKGAGFTLERVPREAPPGYLDATYLCRRPG